MNLVDDLYIPKPVGGDLPTPATFEDFAQEREDRKRWMAAAFRVFARLGMAEGIAGHITVRDPEFADRLWVNPYAVHFSKIRADQLICIDDTGQVIEGDGPINAAAVAIHCGLHRTCPTVTAAVHTHTVHGRAFSALNEPLLPINQEACAFFENHALFKGDVVVLSQNEGERIGKTLGARKSVVMVNHGLLTVASSVEAAAYRFIAMERCCQIQLLAQAAGQIHLIPDEEARKSRSLIGSDYIAWLGFRGLVDAYLDE